MHEISLAQGLLRVALDSLRGWNEAHPEAPAGRIEAIRTGMGLLSCVEPATLAACFELLAEGTAAEGARLSVERRPLACVCRGCGASFSLAERRFVCPSCGGESLSCDGGHGLLLLGLDVHKKD